MTKKKPPKFVQIAISPATSDALGDGDGFSKGRGATLYALAQDGSVWFFDTSEESEQNGQKWCQVVDDRAPSQWYRRDI